MQEFLHSRHGAFKGVALFIALTLAVVAKGLSQTPPPCVYVVTSSMVINNPGHDYVVGDRLRAIGGTSCIEAYPLSLQVNSVGSNGGVTSATIIDAESNGYSTQPSIPIAFGGSASGSDFQASFFFAPR